MTQEWPKGHGDTNTLVGWTLTDEVAPDGE
jgi:hypothetical protein